MFFEGQFLGYVGFCGSNGLFHMSFHLLPMRSSPLPFPFLGLFLLGNESGRFILFVFHMRVYPIVYWLKELFLFSLWSSVCILPSMHYNPLSSRHVFSRTFTNFFFLPVVVLFLACTYFPPILILVINSDPLFFYRPSPLQ